MANKTNMNNENQHTEYKQTWRDEYMKTLAAFANSEGGCFCIGIDDNGEVIGNVYLKFINKI
jgi:predicted HTH transcriptional regulator